MANHDILGLGTSAGGFQALRFLARSFPADFPAAVLVTIHLASEFRSDLDHILAGDGPLPVIFAAEGMTIQPGHIYLAPPKRHLLVDDGLHLGLGPRENNARPAIDAMFRSIAVCCGARSVGVVMTGTLSDGASGLWAIKRCGGTTVVQDPRDAAYPEMPTMALNRAQPDHVAALAKMPALLGKLVREPAGAAVAPPEGLKFEVEVARGKSSAMDILDGIGRRSVLTCPDCQGVMWEIDEDGLVRYRCHVGHAYTGKTMALALDENLRRAMASGLRALEERSALARKLQEQARASGHPRVAKSWAQKAEESDREVAVIRDSMRRMEDAATAVNEVQRDAAE